jgi:hypothetical protein
LLGGLLETDGLEGVIHAASDEALDLFHRVPVGGVDEVGGAQGLCQLQLRLDPVHRHDPARTGNGRALDCREPDPAAPEYGHR